MRVREGVPFPQDFVDRVQNIFKRLFRVYAHIYYCHFERMAALGAEPHLNTCAAATVALFLIDVPACGLSNDPPIRVVPPAAGVSSTTCTSSTNSI